MMSGVLAGAVVFITAALVLYTCGVFYERKKRSLNAKALVLFYLGLVCDTAGTLLMSRIAGADEGAGNPVHAVTGVIAIVLMAFHAVWATVVLKRGNQRAKENFHKFSIIVWAIWLIPYIIGLAMGMGR